MTISSLAKKLIGVNNVVVENLNLEEISGEEQIVIQVRPHKKDQCRCGICGRISPRFDHGKGVRRWRAPDWVAELWSTSKLKPTEYVVKNMVL